MTGSEAKVLGVLCSRANNETLRCSPPRTVIAREAGVCKSSVGGITHALEMRGAIRKWRTQEGVSYQILFETPGWISERPHLWQGKTKRSKRRSDLARNGETGRFAAQNFGDGTTENFGNDNAE
jgi:hypothetical protein